ncbi:MAG: hypothetical protein K2K84_06625, partial [Muribaculaceae bacterium]|nr:hypothetical protein [Muribaculaceae bacterium]
MIKSFTYALAGAMVFTASLFSATTEATAQNTAAMTQRQRIERPRRQQKAPKKVPAKKLLVGNKKLYGVLCSEYEGVYEGRYGLVEIDETAGNHTFLMDYDNSRQPYAGVYMDGKILQSYSNEMDLVTYYILDTEKYEAVAGPWNYTASGGVLKDYMPYAMAYDHTSSMVYSCFYEDAARFWVTEEKMEAGIVPSARFGMFDINNPLDPVTIINENLPERMRAMCFDKDGQLYGLAFTGQMYKINKFTGESTPTVHIDLFSSEGSTLVPYSSYCRESMACDWDTGIFYLAYGDDYDNGFITSIDPKTGETEILGDYSYNDFAENFGDIFTSIFFKQTLPEVIKPAPVEDLVISADGTALRANVNFTMPVLDNKGNSITDNMSWHISDGVNELGSGTAKAGASVKTTVPVAAAGRNQIVVYTTLN